MLVHLSWKLAQRINLLLFPFEVLHDSDRNRLRVVSNFGDGDCGAGKIDTRARAKFRGDATRRERRPSRRVASKFRKSAPGYM